MDPLLVDLDPNPLSRLEPRIVDIYTKKKEIIIMIMRLTSDTRGISRTLTHVSAAAVGISH